jgi:hypothetical protein
VRISGSIFERYDGNIDKICIFMPIYLLALYMIVIVKCFYLLFFQTPGMGKYYKFRTGPPSNWEQLCVIFEGTTATGKLRYASTQSPPPSTCGNRHVDLNIPPAIVDLTEPHLFPQQVSRDKGKGKRHASPVHSLRSSKRSSSIPEVFQMVTDKLTSLQNNYENKCNINESGHSRTAAPVQEAPPIQSHSEIVMDRINNFVSTEMVLPVDSYLRACRAIKKKDWARIVVKMNDYAFRGWLLKQIQPGDT